MAAHSTTLKPSLNSEEIENTSTVNSDDVGVKRRLSFASEKDVSALEASTMAYSAFSLQGFLDDSNLWPLSAAEITEQLSPDKCLMEKNAIKDEDLLPERNGANNTEANDNDRIIRDGTQDSPVTTSKQHTNTEERDAEVRRRAQEEGCVNVVLPGTVTQDACYRFVSEILKFILYQRQQLPMTYDQLVYSQKKQQASVQDKDAVRKKPVKSADMDSHKCQQTLQELEELLHQLEGLFSLSRVPRVLLFMGGSLVLPKELYEINMEDLALAGGDRCLRVSSCLRQLFRTLFVADLLSDTKHVRLMPTTVLVLAHRDSGVGWFRPKLQFKVPTRVKKQVIALSTDPSICKEPKSEGSDWEDYVWFQSPMAIKGISS
ncbi:MAD2L1-binding protein [Melanotaenia boesemani]|uniref:MAD2L1-binding protein n=1 Tax=Melanotaenia boesemani TaxID=1250792 RepID=UPI001C04B732|nr:MAD2L1-binding protein [Melanotaenia boesemani]